MPQSGTDGGGTTQSTTGEGSTTQSDTDGGGTTQSTTGEGSATQSDTGEGSTTGGECVGDQCNPASSCFEIRKSDPAVPSGVYPIDPDGAGPAATIKVFCDQETDGGGWTMVFKLSSGIDGDPLVLWLSPALNESDESLLGTDKSNAHYVSGFVGNFWNRGGVVVHEARVHIYKGAELKKFWKYDVTGSNLLDWYDFLRLRKSSYNDVAAPFQFYGIAGDDTNRRRFFISRPYGGSDGDEGWLTVDATPDACPWENLSDEAMAIPAVAPIRILYAPGTTSVVWRGAFLDTTIGVGDVFAVFVR